MRLSYRLFYIVSFLGLTGWLYWSMIGAAAHRRSCCLPEPVAEKARTQPHFTALLFPRLTEEKADYTVSAREFESILKGLKALGYHSISPQDVRDFYTKGRALPTRAVLLGLDRDDPESVKIADRALARQRMRATVFLIEGHRRVGL